MPRTGVPESGLRVGVACPSPGAIGAPHSWSAHFPSLSLPSWPRDATQPCLLVGEWLSVPPRRCGTKSLSAPSAADGQQLDHCISP
jgi:hypothetical protein